MTPATGQWVTVRCPTTGPKGAGSRGETFPAILEEVLPRGRFRIAAYGEQWAREQFQIHRGQRCPVEQRESGLWHAEVGPDDIVEG